MSPYTKLAVRSLGPTKAVTREEHAQIPTYVPNSPSRGTRKHSTQPKPTDDGRWWEQGPCARQGHDSIWMQPSKFPKAEVHAAASLCAKCPVKVQCAAQPYPHVGITAGKIHWDGVKGSVEVRLCELCLEPMSRRGRFCSQTCKDRWHYRARIEEGEQQYGPLRAWFGSKSVTTMAKECGVAVRTVYRWDASGVIPPGAVKQLTSRLGVQVEDIWPDNVIDIRTRVRSGATLVGYTSESGAAGNSPDSDRSPMEAPMDQKLARLSTPAQPDR